MGVVYGLIAVLAAGPAWSLPTGGARSGGAATITSPRAKTVQVDQSSEQAVINRLSFGIASDASVAFRQPSASALMLNRVVGNDPSAIFGQLSANGQIFLINPNGILFGSGPSVDVGGLALGAGERISLDVHGDGLLSLNLLEQCVFRGAADASGHQVIEFCQCKWAEQIRGGELFH